MKWYWGKYPAWVKVLVIIGVVIGIGMALSDAFKGSQKAGDWLSNPDRSSSQAEEVVSNKTEANTRPTLNVLKVKGFYLGMDINEAAELLNTKYADITRKKLQDGTFKPGASVEQMESGMFRIVINKESKDLIAIYYDMATGVPVEGSGCMVSIKAGNDKKVTELYLDGSISDALFNSKDMDCKTFTEEFAKAYNISNFEPFIKEEKTLQWDGYTNTSAAVPVYRNFYKYSSDKGYYIEISEEKNLLIKTIPKSKERGFD